MINHLRGKITHCTPTSLVIDVNGVGWTVHISLYTFSQVEGREEANLLTYLHLNVGQAGMTYAIYGFAEEGERQLFEHLISVNGVGANTARLMLSAASPLEVSQAIVAEDLNFFKKIKGIGEKTAKLIILTLREKILKTGISVDENAQSLSSNNKVREEALSALVALGFPKPAVQKTLNAIIKQQPAIQSVEQLIKLTLAALT